MPALGGLRGRRRCLGSHFRALFWSRAKQRTCQRAFWLRGDCSRLSVPETCDCTILGFKESLKSHGEHQKAPAAVSLAEDNGAQSNNLEIIFACLTAASLLRAVEAARICTGARHLDSDRRSITKPVPVTAFGRGCGGGRTCTLFPLETPLLQVKHWQVLF